MPFRKDTEYWDIAVDPKMFDKAEGRHDGSGQTAFLHFAWREELSNSTRIFFLLGVMR